MQRTQYADTWAVFSVRVCECIFTLTQLHTFYAHALTSSIPDSRISNFQLYLTAWFIQKLPNFLLNVLTDSAETATSSCKMLRKEQTAP